MKKTVEIPVITNLSIEPFLSQELADLSDGTGFLVKSVPVPYMEYREYGEAYSRAERILVWLNLEGMLPYREAGDGALQEEYMSDLERFYQEVCRYLSGVSQAEIIIVLLEDYFSPLPIVTGYDNDVLADELNSRIQKGLSGQAVFLDLMHMIASVGIGSAYSAKNRYRRGVILAVCSKNDLSDVLAVFRGHGEMILREEHIACFQVNWDNKPDNIARIAGTLGIGFDSMVFVDDSPLELEAVRALLPEVTVIPYRRETVYGCFQCFHLRRSYPKADYEKRNETYRTDRQRQLLREESGSYSDYLTSLQMQIDIHKAVPLELARMAELTRRTNRCTNGRRYSVADLRRRMERSDVCLYSVHLKDRYSDLGLIGAMEVEEGRLSLFSLSCRALGREVENRMIDFLKRQHQITEIDFIVSDKNGSLKELFDREFPEAIRNP